MRLMSGLLVAVAIQLFGVGLAAADYESSQAWFNDLPPEERAATQTELILLGNYQYLVDAQFGTGTYNGLIEFQRSRGSVKSGVLSPADRRALDEQAQAVIRELGLQLVEDEQGRVSLPVPTELLTEVEETAEGTRWATPDRAMTLQTFASSGGDQAFAALFESLSAAAKGRIVTYRNYNESRFVVTGHEEGQDFYTMYRNTDAGIVGYRIAWSRPFAERGKTLSVYIASNFEPLGSLPPGAPGGGTEGGAAAVMATQRFGPFVLPANIPDAIALDGEVTEGFYQDFEQALQVRPNARVMLLNSPGGQVSYALAVAREIRNRGMATLVQKEMGCYSACSYIFFAGQPRRAEGELGVHQISSEIEDLVMAQTTLSDVIDTLDQFGVEQAVIVQMLRTPPEEMYIFTTSELVDWGVNQGGSIELAELQAPVATPTPVTEPAASAEGAVAYLHLAQQGSEQEAERSIAYAKDNWASVLGDAQPQISRADSPAGAIFRVLVPLPSIERANSMCSAIKSAGGGCYVSRPGT